MRKFFALKMKIYECEKTQEEVAKAVGISPSAMTNRMKGRCEFSAREMYVIGRELNIPREKFYEYFVEDIAS